MVSQGLNPSYEPLFRGARSANPESIERQRRRWNGFRVRAQEGAPRKTAEPNPASPQ